MKKGIPEKSDSKILADIYRKINIGSGMLKQPLTVEEMVLIFSLAKFIENNFEEGEEE